MKKIMLLTIATIMVFALSACKSEEKASVKDNLEVITEIEPAEKTEKAEETPGGIQEDGKGTVIPLSDAEKTYVLEQTTETWLAMSTDEKDAMVVLIGRWWEAVDGYIVEDYDDMVSVLDHQMEQYYKNKVDESVLETACDIYKLDITKYVVDNEHN